MAAPSNGDDRDDGARRRARAHLRAVLDAVFATGALDDPRWRELAVVFSVSDAGRNFGNGGYAYGDGDAWWSVSFPVLAVRRPVLDYLVALRGAVPERLTRVLLQHDRVSERTRLTPEFHDRSRWVFTPTTARDLIAEIQPRFSIMAS